jgi:thiosulfate reductase cytochrome b subunit
MHWVGVYAMGCMIFSGWVIYNASPSLPFVFPRWAGLGGWLGGALAWHLSAMWLLVLDGVAYLAYGLVSGHLQRDLRPPAPRDFFRDLGDALKFRLTHLLGHYNAVQRVLYDGVLLIVIVQVATGAAIWKPVQLRWLAELFGGYQVARGIHLATMFFIFAFILVHFTLVAIHPRTFVSMVIGLKAEYEDRS